MNETLQKIGSRFRVVALGALIIGGSGLAASHLIANDSSTKVPHVNVAVNDTPLPRDGKTIVSFAPVVKKVAPSVVKVYITTKGKTIQAPESPFGDNDMMRRFFGQQFNFGGRNMHTAPQHGLGSGVVITEDGYIVTNNHVVEDADNIRVALNDGREFTAKVIGRDPKTEIAVIKIEAKGLPFITLADSDKLEVGDLCLAVGNPFGVGQTVTMGMVSAVGRGGVGLDYEDFIQTDAAINPGNSGGALVDAEGRLIGINTLILSRNGGNQGIGFAVPSNITKSIMTGLITEGRVVRGYLGVGIQDVNPALAKQFHLKDNEGALVTEIAPKGPAEKAGFNSGDVVLNFNHKKVTDSRHLKLQVAETTPDTKVLVKVLRDGKEMSLIVTVKELPGDEQVSKNTKSDKGNESDSLNGVTVGDLDSSARAQLHVPNTVKGAVVSDVNQESVAYEAGLRQGDVILEINRTPVKGADDAVKLTENLKDKTLLLKVWSQGGSRYMVVDESKNG